MSSFVFMSVFLSCPLHPFLMICVGQEVLFLLSHSFLGWPVQSAVCFYVEYGVLPDLQHLLIFKKNPFINNKLSFVYYRKFEDSVFGKK